MSTSIGEQKKTQLEQERKAAQFTELEEKYVVLRRLYDERTFDTKTRRRNEEFLLLCQSLSHSSDDKPRDLETKLFLAVTIADYFDRLLEHQWLLDYAEKSFAQLIKPPKRKRPAKSLLALFKLALIYLLILYRKKKHSDCDTAISQLDPMLERLKGNSRQADAYELLGEYNLLRARNARALQRSSNATEHYHDLAAACSCLAASLNRDYCAPILIRKTINLSLSRAWHKVARGRYQQALALLDFVKASVPEKDRGTWAQYYLCRGVCLRTLAGTDGKRLGEAFQELEKCIRLSNEIELTRYQWRAYYEEALYYLVRKETAMAKEQLELLEKYFKKQQLPGWRSQCKNLEGRIALQEGDFSKARDCAEKAAQIAAAYRLPLLQIDALIAASVAIYRDDQFDEQSRYSEAQAKLHLALQLNNYGLQQTAHGEQSNIVLSGLSRLYLTRIALRAGNKPEALNEIRRWYALKPKIQHQWVLQKGAEIENELCGYLTDGFFIASNEQELGYFSHRNRMRNWLLEHAKQNLGTSSPSQLAQALGVSRQLLYQWAASANQTGVEG